MLNSYNSRKRRRRTRHSSTSGRRVKVLDVTLRLLNRILLVFIRAAQLIFWLWMLLGDNVWV